MDTPKLEIKKGPRFLDTPLETEITFSRLEDFGPDPRWLLRAHESGEDAFARHRDIIKTLPITDVLDENRLTDKINNYPLYYLDVILGGKIRELLSAEPDELMKFLDVNPGHIIPIVEEILRLMAKDQKPELVGVIYKYIGKYVVTLPGQRPWNSQHPYFAYLQLQGRLLKIVCDNNYSIEFINRVNDKNIPGNFGLLLLHIKQYWPELFAKFRNKIIENPLAIENWNIHNWKYFLEIFESHSEAVVGLLQKNGIIIAAAECMRFFPLEEPGSNPEYIQDYILDTLKKNKNLLKNIMFLDDLKALMYIPGFQKLAGDFFCESPSSLIPLAKKSGLSNILKFLPKEVAPKILDKLAKDWGELTSAIVSIRDLFELCATYPQYKKILISACIFVQKKDPELFQKILGFTPENLNLFVSLCDSEAQVKDFFDLVFGDLTLVDRLFCAFVGKHDLARSFLKNAMKIIKEEGIRYLFSDHSMITGAWFPSQGSLLSMLQELGIAGAEIIAAELYPQKKTPAKIRLELDRDSLPKPDEKQHPARDIAPGDSTYGRIGSELSLILPTALALKPEIEVAPAAPRIRVQEPVAEGFDQREEDQVSQSLPRGCVIDLGQRRAMGLRTFSTPQVTREAAGYQEPEEASMLSLGPDNELQEFQAPSY